MRIVRSAEMRSGEMFCFALTRSGVVNRGVEMRRRRMRCSAVMRSAEILNKAAEYDVNRIVEIGLVWFVP